MAAANAAKRSSTDPQASNQAGSVQTWARPYFDIRDEMLGTSVAHNQRIAVARYALLSRMEADGLTHALNQRLLDMTGLRTPFRRIVVLSEAIAALAGIHCRYEVWHEAEAHDGWIEVRRHDISRSEIVQLNRAIARFSDAAAHAAASLNDWLAGSGGASIADGALRFTKVLGLPWLWVPAELYDGFLRAFLDWVWGRQSTFRFVVDQRFIPASRPVQAVFEVSEGETMDQVAERLGRFVARTLHEVNPASPLPRGSMPGPVTEERIARDVNIWFEHAIYKVPKQELAREYYAQESDPESRARDIRTSIQRAADLLGATPYHI